MGCVIEGATALHGVEFNLRCEFGVAICVAISCTTLRGVAACGTLGGEC
jgi:hypothetical protein